MATEQDFLNLRPKPQTVWPTYHPVKRNAIRFQENGFVLPITLPISPMVGNLLTEDGGRLLIEDPDEDKPQPTNTKPQTRWIEED